MLLSAEFLGLILLVASAAALGLSIIFDVGRLARERARQMALQRAIDKKKVAVREWTSRSAKISAELEGLRGRYQAGMARRRRALAEIRTVEFGRFEMVHEIEGDQPVSGFSMLLVVRPEFADVDRQDVIFARQIWEFRNVAHIWASSPATATLLARGAFSPRSGIQTTEPIPLALTGPSA